MIVSMSAQRGDERILRLFCQRCAIVPESAALFLIEAIAENQRVLIRARRTKASLPEAARKRTAISLTLVRPLLDSRACRRIHDRSSSSIHRAADGRAEHGGMRLLGC